MYEHKSIYIFIIKTYLVLICVQSAAKIPNICQVFTFGHDGLLQEVAVYDNI